MNEKVGSRVLRCVISNNISELRKLFIKHKKELIFKVLYTQSIIFYQDKEKKEVYLSDEVAADSLEVAIQDDNEAAIMCFVGIMGVKGLIPPIHKTKDFLERLRTKYTEIDSTTSTDSHCTNINSGSTYLSVRSDCNNGLVDLNTFKAKYKIGKKLHSGVEIEDDWECRIILQKLEHNPLSILERLSMGPPSNSFLSIIEIEKHPGKKEEKVIIL